MPGVNPSENPQAPDKSEAHINSPEEESADGSDAETGLLQKFLKSKGITSKYAASAGVSVSPQPPAPAVEKKIDITEEKTQEDDSLWTPGWDEGYADDDDELPADPPEPVHQEAHSFQNEDPAASGAPKPSVKAPVGPLDVEHIRGSLTKGLSHRKVLLASNLEKAIDWKDEQGILVIVFDNSYAASAVQADLGIILERVGELAGRKVSLDIRTVTPGEHGEEVDQQVELIKHIFRGQVIQGE